MTGFFRSNGHAMDKYRHGDHPYALVTGSSLGIGRSLAFELASLGFNVVLHAMTIEELKPVQEEILKRNPGVSVLCLAQDAGIPVDWTRVMEQLKPLNITVLINNVGTSAPVPFNVLDKATDDAIETVIRVNTIFPTQITRNLLPQLVSSGPSLILNICSGSTYAPMGFLSVYCGGKSYNLTWSKSLYNELRMLRRPVDCKAVMTGNVQSHGNDQGVGLFTPDSDTYARSLLKRVNISGPLYYGYRRHALQAIPVQMIGAMSHNLLDKICTKVAKDLLTWRERKGDKTAIRVADLPS
ncbi:hypothetical protein FRB91_005332 [Serendipita sp. 411]|nr:hypothetical protein FRB91_005332 [Serendipita sp. 411]